MTVTKTRSPAEVDALIETALSMPMHRFLALRLIDWKPGESHFELEVGANAATPL